MEELIKRLERVIQTGAPDKDGQHPISAEAVLEVVKGLYEHGTNLAEVGTDAVSRKAVKELAYSQIRSMYCGVALKEQRETMLRIADNVIGLLAPVTSAQPATNCSEFPNNSDTISRQDAVSRRRLLSDLKELITAWEKYPVMAEQIKGVEVAIGYVELIPSAQPEIIRCRNCKFASGDSRICMKFGHSPIGELDFCAWAERRTDEA